MTSPPDPDRDVSGVPPPARPTVLIVEDNEDNRMIYRLGLEHAGYRVLQAVNGAEGVALACASLPDAILMDVSLPVLDGLEATRRLKADPATRHIPIIVITAHAMTTDREKALAAGCDAYLAKPIAPQAVTHAVRGLIGPRDAGG